jgi:hypothetical protein
MPVLLLLALFVLQGAAFLVAALHTLIRSLNLNSTQKRNGGCISIHAAHLAAERVFGFKHTLRTVDMIQIIWPCGDEVDAAYLSAIGPSEICLSSTLSRFCSCMRRNVR